MSAIPLDLQRRFEQRWAARFVRADAAAPKSIGPKGRVKPRRGGLARAIDEAVFLNRRSQPDTEFCSDGRDHQLILPPLLPVEFS